jgi:RNA polymerase sigma-70 factor, ECF subfamily
MDTSSSLLVRLRRSDNQDAWGRFVRLYTPLIYAWGRKVGLQSADAADLVQDVLTTLVRKLPEFDYQQAGSFRGWLRTITLNRWRDQCRRKAARPTEKAANQILDVAAPPDQDSFGELDHRQHLVARALELMQTEFQATTWKACWELVVAGRPAADVARELKISENAVYLAKGRVLRRLRLELEGLLD